jgi:hypothetical protein
MSRQVKVKSYSISYFRGVNIKQFSQFAPGSHSRLLLAVLNSRIVGKALHTNDLHDFFLSHTGFFSKFLDGFHIIDNIIIVNT